MLGTSSLQKGKELVFLYNDLFKVREPKISFETAMKLTRITILEIEFLLALRTE